VHVVVTGAAGFIGSHTCEALRARGHRVTGLDSFDGFLYPAAVKRRNAAALRDVRLIEGDICDPAAVAAAVDESVDVVCHLAALAGVRPSIAEPQRYLRANVEGTGVILERMRAVGLQRLVFASSSSVYGARDRSTSAFREDEPCLTPASPYAATKRMNELQLSVYRDLFGLGATALRFFTVYGPRQRPADILRMGKRNDAARAREALGGAQAEQVVHRRRNADDYTYIADIVAGTVAAIEQVTAGTFEIFNLGGTEPISLADLVASLERVIGKPARIDRLPDQPGDVPVTFASISRARASLGYAPQTALQDGLARFWAWLRPTL